MARRVLSGPLSCSLLLVLLLASCRHEERAPAPSASASAAGKDFTARTRERHLQEELARAAARRQSEASLECAKAMKEKPDLQLCQAAASALATIAGQLAATPELALLQLAPAALALVRLSERARYLSLAELAQRRVERERDAGVASAPAPHAHKEQGSARPDSRALELGDGPAAQLLAMTTRSEREVIRNLGAYLEYGPLPVRRAAFSTVKRLQAEHPQWPLLDHLLQEAVVLESDVDLKRDLRQLTATGDQGGRPGQSAGTK